VLINVANWRVIFLMKKLVAMFLCVLISAFVLASCGEEGYGKVPGNYPLPNENNDNIVVKLYMIYDSESDQDALNTVRDRFRERTSVKYGVTVELVFLSEDEYENQALEATKLNRNPTGSSKNQLNVNLLLVNSAELLDKFVATNRMVDMSQFIFEKADKSNKELVKKYGSLNEISGKLIESIRNDDGSFYAVPNNHIIGEYEYLVINEEIAKQTLKYSNEILEGYKTYDDTAELRDKIAELEVNGVYLNPDDYVNRVYGPYHLKAELEAAGNVCNVISYPTITENEACLSAFAIVDSGDAANAVAMDIIFKLNTDKELRDFLQYGVKGTTYNIDEDGNIVMVEADGKRYRMNLEYTGNVFIASYCKQIKWTEEIAASGEIQNSEAVIAG